MSQKVVLLVVLLSITAAVIGDVSDNTIEEDICALPSKLVEEIKSHQPNVNKIINAITNGKFKGRTYNELANFVDKFGARVSGSKNLEDSIDYMLNIMESNGLENVHGEKVAVPHWVRGEESCKMVLPREADIGVLTLGSSIGTPDEGVLAEVLVVRSFEELQQANFSKAAKGKIVVFNFDFVSYSESVKYRAQGAARAAEHGAVAALIRSVTPFSMYTLHTGEQKYEDNVTKIPAASITVEDARLFQRYQDRGVRIVLSLKIKTQTLPDVTSRNVVGEIVGDVEPEKVVLVSGHIDSWDVGVGAMDDGGGAFVSWYSLAVLKSLGLRAKRTVRAVLWTAEEPGLVGVQGYNEAHKNELGNFTFVMESDEGAFSPLGLEYSAGKRGGCILNEIMKLLAPINATRTSYADAVGSDITIWAGIVPTGSLLNANEKYFWFHHTQSDTMDVLDPDALDRATALWASVAYVIANLSEEFPRDFDNKVDKSVLMQRLVQSVGRGK